MCTESLPILMQHPGRQKYVFLHLYNILLHHVIILCCSERKKLTKIKVQTKKEKGNKKRQIILDLRSKNESDKLSEKI